MDEVGKRLHEAAEKCIKSYESWQTDKKDQPAREVLNESLHELRRATAALEIDMIREERMAGGGNRPMPTPTHRSARKQDDDSSGANDDIGNRGGGDEGHAPSGGGGHDRGPRRSGGGRPGGRPHHRSGGGGQREGNE